MKVGYVVKRYPRYSETFVVNEILAHEAAGIELEIFSLRPTRYTHFQDALARVRAPVRYLTSSGARASTLWSAIEEASAVIPGLFERLDRGVGVDAREVTQAVELAARVREASIQHLHAHFATTAARVTALAAHLAGISFSFTAHAKDIFHEDVSIDALRQLTEQAARVITVSDFNVSYLTESCGLAREKVLRVYNGMPLDEYRMCEAERDGTILAAGRLVEKKGFQYLIEACALLVERGRPVSCEIVGGGELEGELRACIERLGMEGHVHLAGALPRVELARRMREASVFAAPCVVGEDGNRDGLPTVLLEAMASGLPCVATDVTGIPEILAHGETGLIAKQGDAESLADAIERFQCDGDLAESCARVARRRIEEDFDQASNTEALRAVFEACRAGER